MGAPKESAFTSHRGRRKEECPDLVDRELWEECLRLVVADRGVDDNVFALLPVHRRCDAVLVTNLEG